jgi:hypothetical protein
LCPTPSVPLNLRQSIFNLKKKKKFKPCFILTETITLKNSLVMLLNIDANNEATIDFDPFYA